MSYTSQRLQARRWYGWKIELYEGEACPIWYGSAYCRFDRPSIVCYPIVINVIVHYARALWMWVLRVGLESKWDKMLKDAYEQGKRDYIDSTMKETWVPTPNGRMPQ